MSEPTVAPHADSADAVFQSWERLRMVYNVILGLAFIPWLKPFVENGKFTTLVVEGAFAANLCYCAGPVIEGYAALLGIPRKMARYTLFACGTLLALLLELGTILSFLHLLPEGF